MDNAKIDFFERVKLSTIEQEMNQRRTGSRVNSMIYVTSSLVFGKEYIAHIINPNRSISELQAIIALAAFGLMILTGLGVYRDTYQDWISFGKIHEIKTRDKLKGIPPRGAFLHKVKAFIIHQRS